MRKGYAAIGVLLATLAAVAGMVLLDREEEALPARIVEVTKGEVKNVVALTGRVSFLDERAVYAAMPGMVAEVYVEEGQRVAAGQAILRMKSDAVERIAAVWASQEDAAAAKEEVEALLEGTVIRSPVNANVRRVLVTQNAPVGMGAPVAVISSNEQAVVCAAVEKDALRLTKGMEAVLMVEGDVVGRAEVTEIGPVVAEETTGRTISWITLSPRERLMLPEGAAVEADMRVSGRSGVPVLPVEAVTERGTVWWYHDEIVTEIPVQIVLSDEMRAWVDLPEGIRVAIGEFEEGQRIREVSE